MLSARYSQAQPNNSAIRRPRAEGDSSCSPKRLACLIASCDSRSYSRRSHSSPLAGAAEELWWRQWRASKFQDLGLRRQCIQWRAGAGRDSDALGGVLCEYSIRGGWPIHLRQPGERQLHHFGATRRCVVQPRSTGHRLERCKHFQRRFSRAARRLAARRASRCFQKHSSARDGCTRLSQFPETTSCSRIRASFR